MHVPIRYIVCLLFLIPLLGISQITEDFEGGAGGWTDVGTPGTGNFVVGNPNGTNWQLENDHTAGGTNAMYTATNPGGGDGADDVDGGTAILQSPLYNISDTSTLSIWYFFGQRDNGDDAGDFFRLEYSIDGGSSYTTMVAIGDVTNTPEWTEATVNIPAGSNLRIRMHAADGVGGGDIIEAGIDDVTISDASDNPRPYEERYAENLQGNFLIKGNTNLECVSGCPATPRTNNPGVNMGYIDVDSDGSTVNSSSSNITIPAGATVTYAGLYWGGLYNSTRSGITNPAGTLDIDQVKLRTPAAAAYSTISAEVRNIETDNFAQWNSFMAHADITSAVKAGGSGTYFVADIALATGRAFTGPYGGWTMVVVYKDSTEKSRRINVWDGFDFFGFGANDNFTVTGLLTPAGGAFETHAGYFGFDGEANQTGDFVSINGTPLANALNPNDNTLNGTISEFGVDVGGRNPNFSYSWGIDSDIFDASGTVPNGANDLDVVLGSSSEGIWGGVFVVSNEVAFPAVSSKVFTPSTISHGDVSSVAITVENPSDGVLLTNFSLTDNLPPGMTISTTPNASSSCGGVVTADAGSSAFSVTGLIIPAGTTCVFNFDVDTDDLGVYLNTLSPDDVSNSQNIPLQGENSGTLTVNVRSVITNRKITHRVSKN